MPILPADLALPALGANGGRTPRYGADVSFYLPTSARVRRLFGNDWFGVGPAFNPVQISNRAAFRTDIDVLSQSRSGNDALLVFAGGEIARSLTRSTGYFLPYGGVGLNLVYAHVDADEVGISFNRLSVAASAFVGTRLGRNAYLEARYRLTPTLEGLNFSGTSLTVGVRF